MVPPQHTRALFGGSVGGHAVPGPRCPRAHSAARGIQAPCVRVSLRCGIRAPAGALCLSLRPLFSVAEHAARQHSAACSVLANILHGSPAEFLRQRAASGRRAAKFKRRVLAAPAAAPRSPRLTCTNAGVGAEDGLPHIILGTAGARRGSYWRPRGCGLLAPRRPSTAATRGQAELCSDGRAAATRAPAALVRFCAGSPAVVLRGRGA